MVPEIGMVLVDCEVFLDDLRAKGGRNDRCFDAEYLVSRTDPRESVLGVAYRKTTVVLRAFEQKRPWGDQQVNYGLVVALMTALQGAGAPSVGLVTEAPVEEEVLADEPLVGEHPPLGPVHIQQGTIEISVAVIVGRIEEAVGEGFQAHQPRQPQIAQGMGNEG